MLALTAKNPQMTRRNFMKVFGALSLASGVPQQAARNTDDAALIAQNVAGGILEFFR